MDSGYAYGSRRQLIAIKPRRLMHLGSKRLTPKYVATKMFFASHSGQNPGSSDGCSVVIYESFDIKSHHPYDIAPAFVG